jgi:hypothetical protein
MNYSIQPKYKKVPQIPTEEDISNYTDNDLYQLLDLNNPTDRELEAKLYSLIDKYNTVKGNIGKQLKNLYINIFNRFFETDDQEETDSTTSENEEEKKPLIEGFASAPATISTSTPTPEPTYTKNIDYTKGNLNPILKETVKRVVSIDSSFRNVKNYPYTTDFTFNLSETLRDVVSLKLYSVSIPYNWYTINQDYGSNVIYINGNSNGINNGNFNYKITIPYGNYTASDLITAVNSSIQKNVIETNRDISFGKTGVSYNNVNGRCTMTLDITNNYNETNYQLYFPGFTFDFSNNRTPKQSIPELLGYKYSSYNPFTIYSSPNFSSSSMYEVTDSNKELKIHIYQASRINGRITSYTSTSTATPLFTIPITLSLESGQHSGDTIIQDLNSKLSNNTSLVKAYSKIEKLDISGYTGYTGFKYGLSIKPDRRTTVNTPDQKIVVEFPPDASNAPIWTGGNSLFNFSNKFMEFQNIYSETNNFTSSYKVNSSPFIILHCVANGYKTDFKYINSYYEGIQSLNDYKIDISNSPATGFTLSDYYTSIQRSFNTLKKYTNNQIILNIGNTNNLSVNDVSYNTYIDCSINKTIPSKYFYLDISSSFLSSYSTETTTTNTLNFGRYLQNGINKSTVPQSVFNSGIIVDNTNNKLYIHPIKDENGNNGDNRLMTDTEIEIPPKTRSFNDLITTMNETFQTYRNKNISLTNTKIYYDSIGNDIEITINLDVRAVLTNRDYDLYFFDASSISSQEDAETTYNCYNYDDGSTPLNYNWFNTDASYSNGAAKNTWRTYFGFNDPSYTVVNSPITGTEVNKENLLLLTTKNNYFQLIPVYDPEGGVYSATSNNNITYTLPSTLPVNKLYTKEQIRDAINTVLNAPGSIAQGSYVDTTNLTTLFRLNINKTFKAKDYSVVFYDESIFTKCSFGPNSSTGTTTADTTLGWKMGFRENIMYNLTPDNLKTNISDGTTYYGNSVSNSYTYDANTGIATLTGDTSVNVNLYNYFLIVLDDYTQNHLNDGLITTVNADIDVSLPSYATKSSYKCIVPLDKVAISDTTTHNNYNRLTNAQVYSANQILNTQKTKYLNNVYSSGPFIQDIFGIIPVKTAGLSYGQTYSEFGGTLQIQERVYFGPVNISRMTVRIMTDKGNILDLNNQNWSFSLITEQLYNPNRG